MTVTFGLPHLATTQPHVSKKSMLRPQGQQFRLSTSPFLGPDTVQCHCWKDKTKMLFPSSGKTQTTGTILPASDFSVCVENANYVYMLRPWRRQIRLQLRLFCCVLGTSVTRRSRPLVESECACKLLHSKWRALAFAALRNTFSISEHTTIHSNVHMHSDPAARPSTRGNS